MMEHDKEVILALTRRITVLETENEALKMKNSDRLELRNEAETRDFAVDEEPCVVAVVRPGITPHSTKAPSSASSGAAGRGAEVCAPTCKCHAVSTLDAAKKNKALLHFAGMGNLEVVQWLLSQGADVTCRDGTNKTPLHHAANKGHVQVVKALIASSALIDAWDNDGVSPLFFACSSGHIEVVAVLLVAGAAVESREGAMNSPLIVAAVRGHIECMSLLMAKGANINVQTPNGITALAWAALIGRETSVRLLLQANADTTIRDNTGKSAKDYAEKFNFRSLFP